MPVLNAGVATASRSSSCATCDGDDVRTLVRRTRTAEPERAAQITEQAGEALDAIHAAGLVHRDVKPAERAARGGRPRLSSPTSAWRSRCCPGDGQTRSGQWVGTLDFVAPEQIRGQPRRRPDRRLRAGRRACSSHAHRAVPFSRRRATRRSSGRTSSNRRRPRRRCGPAAGGVRRGRRAARWRRTPRRPLPVRRRLGRAAVAAVPRRGVRARASAWSPSAPRRAGATSVHHRRVADHRRAGDQRASGQRTTEAPRADPRGRGRGRRDRGGCRRRAPHRVRRVRPRRGVERDDAGPRRRDDRGRRAAAERDRRRGERRLGVERGARPVDAAGRADRPPPGRRDGRRPDRRGARADGVRASGSPWRGRDGSSGSTRAATSLRPR